jgi:hypothetical protein
MIVLVTFSGISYCDNRERVFIFDYDTKEKEHQNTRTNQIASSFDALSITKTIFCRAVIYYDDKY